jgi:hypothetical protein
MLDTNEILKKIAEENKNKPHPKNNEELQKILEKIEEKGGPKAGTTKFGDWSLNGRTTDF